MSAEWSGRYTSGVLVGAVAADAATGGRIWVVNQLDSKKLLVVHRITLTPASATGATTAITRVNAERMSFTGTPSGAQGVPAPVKSQDALPAGISIRTASTGMVITAGPVIGSVLMGYSQGTPNDWIAPEPVEVYHDEHQGGFNFIPGEGLVIRQADAGDVDQQFMVGIEFHAFAYGLA